MQQTTLDLNGPILSFVTQPVDVTVCSGVAATFTGIATATFPTQIPVNPASNTGIITYRWYDQNGPLFDNPPPEGGDGVTISGSGTTTLSLYNNTQTRRLYVKADYIPSAYQSSSPVTAGTARSTGNAINEPIDSNTVNLTLYPLISITSEPLDATASQGAETTFSTTATATDGSDVSYQWQLNGQNLTDTTTQTTSTTPIRATITVTDDLGSLTTIDFNTLSSYSNFIKGRTYTLVSSADITTKVTAAGAGGGTSAQRSVKGGAGGLSTGTFTFLAGQTYKLIVGGAGVNAGAGGFGGGGNGGGGSGQGGGGGGYTGLFRTSITQANAIIIAGGGGGGSNDASLGGSGGGTSGGNAENFNRGGGGGTQASGGAAGASDGSPGTAGSALQGGPGAAGGGGGYFGGGGGQFYNGCCADGGGGGGSGYIHPTLLTDASTTQGAGSAPTFDGTFKIDLVSSQFTAITTVKGSQTPNLKILTNVTGLNQVRCIISHPTACNSPLFTRSANFTVVNARSILNFEFINPDSSVATLLGWNLSTQGIYTYTNTSSTYPTVVFYALEQDLDLELELYAAKGLDAGNFRGGEGGVSTIRFTAKKNEEYVLAPLPKTGESGAIYLYRKSRLIAVVGAGGDAGSNGNGGSGGGVNVSGANGNGTGAGRGGSAISAGSLPQTGIFGSTTAQNPISGTGDTKASAPDGGRVLPCARGGYWRDQGKQPCEDLGNTKFYLDNGVLVTTSATISRGFKPGYSIRQTSGVGINGGQGGQGATGGQGGVDRSGGGGGSGYTDGSITILSTRRGGNNGSTKVIFKLYTPPPPTQPTPPPPPLPPPPPPPAPAPAPAPAPVVVISRDTGEINQSLTDQLNGIIQQEANLRSLYSGPDGRIQNNEAYIAASDQLTAQRLALYVQINNSNSFVL